jgi:hypothetical protein
VNAADYMVWRKGLGTIYGQSDFEVWRTHFGQSATGGTGISISIVVPEPAALLLTLAASLSLATLRRRRSS